MRPNRNARQLWQAHGQFKNKKLKHINTEGERRGNGKSTDKLTIMQVLGQEYCNLSVDRVALHHTDSALAPEA